MAVKKTTTIKKSKSTTNYSDAQITRNLKVKMERKLSLALAAKKGKDASKKINATWTGNKKPKSTISKAKRSTAQLRAIYAKKK